MQEVTMDRYGMRRELWGPDLDAGEGIAADFPCLLVMGKLSLLG